MKSMRRDIGVHMRFWHVSGSVLVLVLLLIRPVPVHANSLAFGTATLDWTGFRMTFQGNLAAQTRGIYLSNNFSCSSAQPTPSVFGVCKNSLNSPVDWDFTSASFEFSNSDGLENAHATTSDGFLSSDASAAALSANPGLFSGFGLAKTSRWFQVFGTGTLTLTIPYNLSLVCDTDGASSSTAVASVEVSSVANVLSRSFSGDSITCADEGSRSKSGILIISGDVGNAATPFGNSFAIDIDASVDTTARVPEPPVGVLLTVALVGIWSGRKWASRRPIYKTEASD